MKITLPDGRTVYEGPAMDLADFPDELPLGVEVSYGPDEIRAQIRQRIDERAGDSLSRLGTTSDAAALAVFGLASLVAKLSTAGSLAEVRAAAEPFAAMSADFLAKVEAGDVKLPFMAKGIEATIAEIETRATAVTEALTPPE
ncbi:hypothetical protein AIOL_001945 [Candidatus Rhodobacter oscarellae]|uniref:Uncharacterized protein n=1 Tax=Candidatus Rhodobacter oscarellae TaxID=1675527 RepID=A0A0J9E2Q4_9RHOB|nr:hypothetical protein [Candidatus Rhodobacter lobularis]KMW56987.1 hypothetical protein AIOL_001945 [Candidatus Rhodobacter lobularis]